MSRTLIATAFAIASLPAFAQTSQKAADLQATETMLMTEITAHRDWQATAIDLQTKVKTLSDMNAELTKQLADMKTKLDAAAKTPVVPTAPVKP